MEEFEEKIKMLLNTDSGDWELAVSLAHSLGITKTRLRELFSQVYPVKDTYNSMQQAILNYENIGLGMKFHEILKKYYEA